MLFVLIRIIRESYVRSPGRAIHESHELTPTKPKVNWSFDTHSNAWIIQSLSRTRPRENDMPADDPRISRFIKLTSSVL